MTSNCLVVCPRSETARGHGGPRKPYIPLMLPIDSFALHAYSALHINVSDLKSQFPIQTVRGQSTAAGTYWALLRYVPARPCDICTCLVPIYELQRVYFTWRSTDALMSEHSCTTCQAQASKHWLQTDRICPIVSTFASHQCNHLNVSHDVLPFPAGLFGQGTWQHYVPCLLCKQGE